MQKKYFINHKALRNVRKYLQQYHKYYFLKTNGKVLYRTFPFFFQLFFFLQQFEAEHLQKIVNELTGFF